MKKVIIIFVLMATMLSFSPIKEKMYIKRPDCEYNQLYAPPSGSGTCELVGEYTGVYLGGPTTNPNVYEHKTYWSCWKNGVNSNVTRTCVDEKPSMPPDPHQ